MEQEVNNNSKYSVSLRENCFSFNFIDIVVPASVPGGIYSDLEAFGGIFQSEIYSGYNDMETRWVGHTNWTFSRHFSGALFSN